MSAVSMLSGCHLSLISGPLEGEVAEIASTIEHKAVVGGRGDVEALLCDLMAAARTLPGRARTLDLIGHSTPDLSLLRIGGDWVLDGSRRTTRAFFRELADHDVMATLGVRAVRLLGCETALTLQGRVTICELAEILGVEVLGTRGMLRASHYRPAGFNSDCLHGLVGASALLGSSPPSRLGEPYIRTLDLDGLPASPLAVRAWPIAIASPTQIGEVLRLVQRNAGAYMPGLDARPLLEIAIPVASKRGWYQTIQIVLDGTFVRVVPEPGQAAVVFPVSDARQLHTLIDSLPRAPDDRAR